jgi:hypothetical protein
MRRFFLLLACLSTLGLAACSAADITGPTSTQPSLGFMGSGS